MMIHVQGNIASVDKAVESLTTQASTQRLRLANGAVNDDQVMSPSDLGSLLNSVAETEGALFILTGVQTMLNRGKTFSQAVEVMVGAILQGADDNWSGRGGDVKRSRFDGMLEAHKSLRYCLDDDEANYSQRRTAAGE